MPSIESQESIFLESSTDLYYDFSLPSLVPSTYHFWDNTFITEEATDEDIIIYAAKSPAFDFLCDPEEDIYTLEDGEEVCH